MMDKKTRLLIQKIYEEMITLQLDNALTDLEIMMVLAEVTSMIASETHEGYF